MVGSVYAATHRPQVLQSGSAQIRRPVSGVLTWWRGAGWRDISDLAAAVVGMARSAQAKPSRIVLIDTNAAVDALGASRRQGNPSCWCAAALCTPSCPRPRRCRVTGGSQSQRSDWPPVVGPWRFGDPALPGGTGTIQAGQVRVVATVFRDVVAALGMARPGPTAGCRKRRGW